MVKPQLHTKMPEQWLSYVTTQRGESDLAILRRAMSVYDDPVSPLLAKGIVIAEMLLQLQLDTETLAGALLYPALKQQQTSFDFVTEHFGVSVGNLLRDTMQMQPLAKLQQMESTPPHQIENLRKMLLAMVTDIRAVLIILAERLWQLREAKIASPEEQKKISRETLNVYAPLANRIGVWELKWEMEDLCLRYLNPDDYSAIAKGLASRREEREIYIKKVIQILHDKLNASEMKKFEIAGRVKHIYSIYNKMQKKNIPLEKIYDISALRVLVPEVDDCYAVLSLLHANWKQIPEEFDDYIAQPKSNGYQSIHTVLYGPDDHAIEVQIRTYQMHHDSELGAASHWRYKEGLKEATLYEGKIALLRQIMEWQKEISDHTTAKPDQPIQDIFADRVYVFTPLGDIIDLPSGATPLDFAYHVHSEVGHRCRGAKVDDKMVTLTHPLQTGNRVVILTAKEPNPSRDWLNPHLGYIKSPRARSILQHWFRVKDNAKERETAEKESPRKSRQPEKSSVSAHASLKTFPKKVTRELTGIDNLLTKIARCCKPLPGDEVIGYITQNDGVSIHRVDCSNVANLKNRRGERFLNVNWGSASAGIYPVELLLRARHQTNLLRDITGALANENIQMAGLRLMSYQNETCIIYLSILIASVDELNKAIKILRQLQHVIEVSRR